jgi:hypothetical protein
MFRITTQRDYFRQMSTAEHLPECPSVTAREPWWPIWAPVDEDGNWCDRSGKPFQALGWLGPKPKWEPPKCDGCVSPSDRALFARLADEIDAYLGIEVPLF